MSTVQDFQPPTADEMRLHRPLSGENAQTDKASVEQIEVNGRRYLVFPLIAAREMVLDYPENGTRELLPARHLQESVSLWDGTPITFVHPENDRRTADDPREYTQTIIGQAYQPKIKDKEKLQVMAYIDVEKATDFGGLAATVVEKLKNGEELGVSAGYATLNDDPTGGVFNGTEYDIEQGYIIPDHIAVFPNDEFKARCDWEDGCGAPRTNYVCENAQASDQHKDRFEDEAAAEARAAQLGCEGTHEHPDDGDVMPCASHAEYEEALKVQRENRVTACDVEENYDVDRPAAESVRTLVNEYRRSDSLNEFKERLNGDEPLSVTDTEEVYAMFETAIDSVNQNDELTTPSFSEGDIVDVQALDGVWGRIVHIPDDTELGLAMVDLFGEGEFTLTLGLDDLNPKRRENIPAETESYTLTRNGEYVVWDTGRERQHGQIVAVAEDGCLEIDGRERCVDADNPTRIVQVQHYSDDGEVQEKQSLKLVRMDGPNEDNLRSWNAPRSARMNAFGGTRTTNVTAEIGDREVDLTPPSAVVNAAELALEKKEELELDDCGTGVGEQRAEQIVSGDLTPEDFLTRENGTPIPTYLDSHSSDVNGLTDPPTTWSDDEWRGILSEGDEQGCGPVQYALWGGTATGTGLDWATGVRDELRDALDAADETLNTITTNTEVVHRIDEQNDTMRVNISEGEYVQWDWSDGTAYGQVTETVDEGTRSVDGNQRSVDADDDERIAVIDQYSQDGEPQNQRVIKLIRPGDESNEDSLRSWDAPREARENASEDPATLFQRFLSSIGYGKQNSAGAEELMDDVESSVDIDESDTTEEAEDTKPTDETEPTETTNDTEESTEKETEDTESDVDETVDETDTESETEDEVVDEGGENSVEETDTDGGNTSDIKENMDDTKENQADDLDLEDIAAKTAFGVSELEEMDDMMLSALERTVQEMASDYDAVEDAEGEDEAAVSGEHDKEYRNTENNESETNTENTVVENESTKTESEETTINTDEFLTQEQAEEQFASSEDVEEVNENIEQIKGMVQNIQTEQESEETEQKARMVANAIEGMSVEAAKSLPEDELDNLVETHGTRTNYGAVPGQMERAVTTNTQGEDPTDYPAGGRSAWQESKAAEGGD